MKRAIIIFLVLLLGAAGSIFGGYRYLDNYISKDEFYPGIEIEGLDMSGLSLEEGIEKLNQLKRDELESRIEISTKEFYADKYYINYSDLGYSFNINEIATEAFKIGREGNVLDRYRAVKDLEENKRTYALTPTYDLSVAKDVFSKIAKDINTEPIDSTFSFVDGEIVITKHHDGRIVDVDKMYKKLEDGFPGIKEIEIPVSYIPANETDEYYGKINGVIGEFSTNFYGSAPGRIHNIKLSASSFKGMLIMPGDVISYNETTGPRQEKFGYQEAPVILNGELTPGMGGGVCQTSTTLYNALLLADLEIVERHPHSIAPAYVPRGTDGAVATGYLDLRFKNNFDYPIYIDSYVEGNNVHFKIYGDLKNRDYTIKIETQLVGTIPYKVREIYDDTLEPGARVLVQDGRTGYKVSTFKSIIQDNKVISKEKISSDYYRERDYIYNVGPKVVEVIDEDEEVTLP